ncbi:MAG: hypothetical protein GMKNLPBB_00450 [Myxococcota bacterium]|nr:hypothetical protein [Myxococcota bacterium]
MMMFTPLGSNSMKTLFVTVMILAFAGCGEDIVPSRTPDAGKGRDGGAAGNNVIPGGGLDNTGGDASTSPAGDGGQTDSGVSTPADGTAAADGTAPPPDSGVSNDAAEPEDAGNPLNDAGSADQAPQCDIQPTCKDDKILEECSADKSSIVQTDCGAAGGACLNNKCTACKPNSTRCVSPGEIETCAPDGTGYVKASCGVLKRCDNAANACVDAVCTPGKKKCKDTGVLLECNADGTKEEAVECKTKGANFTCSEDACVDLCQEAVLAQTYTGCEYWSAPLSNSQLDDKSFDGEFAVVIANTHPSLTADIKVESALNGAPAVIKTTKVPPGQTGILKFTNAEINWAATKTRSLSLSGISSRSVKVKNALRITSTIPVSAYQFNPLSSSVKTSAREIFSYTNDASLLLPAHIHDKAYLGMSYPHLTLKPRSSTTQIYDNPSYLAVVATSPGQTKVDFLSRGVAAPGGGFPALTPGQSASITLEQYEVLTIATRSGLNPECSPPKDPRYREICIHEDADLSGSVITSNQPVAVFGGADCTMAPYNKFACDHIEEQIFPFSRWGTTYAGTQHEPQGNKQDFDYFHVLAGVDGTALTIEPSIPGITTPKNMKSGQVFRFQNVGGKDFVISSQDINHPILMAQYFPGQEVADPELMNAQAGDPSMVIAAPTDQYRRDYIFLTPNTIAKDYMNVIRPKDVKVMLDGKELPNDRFVDIGAQNLQVGRFLIGDGAHALTAEQPVGLIVYGFDRYVSFGYLGGLDLKPLNSASPLP